MADLEPDEFDPFAGVNPDYLTDAPPPVEADPDEEPPEPEGHPMSEEVKAWILQSGYWKEEDFWHGHLPHDIAAIWASPPARVVDEATARILIGTWGTDGFRGSALHLSSLAERARAANSSEVTARFKAEREREKRK